MQVIDFSIGLKHKDKNKLEGDEAIEATGEPTRRKLLVIVLNTMPTKQVRLHVYEHDDPKEYAFRLMALLMHKNFLLLTEQNNVHLFRMAIENFI